MALHILKLRQFNVLLSSLGRGITRPMPTPRVRSSQQCLSDQSRNSATGDVVVLTDDGSTVVCWHPEQPFPYECTRPLPEIHAVKDCVLNMQEADAYRLFTKKSDEVVRQELMKATHTTKHRWFPRSRDKFAKNTPPDREYL